MATLTDFLTGIANTLRQNLGTEEPINATDFESKITESTANGYSAGYGSGNADGYTAGTEDGIGQGTATATLAFWNCFTNNGNRTVYSRAFNATNFSGQTIPTGLCKPISQINQMFYEYKGTTLPSGVDFSGVTTTSADSLQLIFSWTTNITVIPDMGLPAIAHYDGTYANCSKLETIEIMRVNANTQYSKYTPVFQGCPKLKKYYF